MTHIQKQQAKYYILCIEHNTIDQKEIINWADSLILIGNCNQFIIEISMSKKDYDIKPNLLKISRDVKWDGIIESYIINQILNAEDHKSLNSIFRKLWHKNISKEIILSLYYFDDLIDDCHDTKSDEVKTINEILQLCKINCIPGLLKIR